MAGLIRGPLSASGRGVGGESRRRRGEPRPAPAFPAAGRGRDAAVRPTASAAGTPAAAGRSPGLPGPNPGGPKPFFGGRVPDRPPARRRVVVVGVMAGFDAGLDLRRPTSAGRSSRATSHVPPISTGTSPANPATIQAARTGFACLPPAARSAVGFGRSGSRPRLPGTAAGSVGSPIARSGPPPRPSAGVAGRALTALDLPQRLRHLGGRLGAVGRVLFQQLVDQVAQGLAAPSGSARGPASAGPPPGPSARPSRSARRTAAGPVHSR